MTQRTLWVSGGDMLRLFMILQLESFGIYGSWITQKGTFF